MAQADEVKAFARDFVNNQNARTQQRKSKIKAVYFQLTGERIKGNCGTCYVEAIIKIIRIMDNKPCKYRLRKGAVLTAFSDASKTCTNVTLTDELAEWHLRNVRGCAGKFIILPEDAPQYGDPEGKELEIVKVPIDTKVEKPIIKPAIAKPKRPRSKRKPRAK